MTESAFLLGIVALSTFVLTRGPYARRLDERAAREAAANERLRERLRTVLLLSDEEIDMALAPEPGPSNSLGWLIGAHLAAGLRRLWRR